MVSDSIAVPWHRTAKGKAYARDYYRRNREAAIARAKRWVKNNPSKRREILLKFAAAHLADELERGRRRRKENPNRDLIRLKRWQRMARKHRPQFIMKTRLRTRIYRAMERGFTTKSAKTIELLGCTFEELRNHIEKQFADGMSWERIKEIDLDHIKPCASFDLTDPNQQRECFHYSNLQPLWRTDNRRKGSNFSVGIAITHDSQTRR